MVLTHFAILQRLKLHTGDWLREVSDNIRRPADAKVCWSLNYLSAFRWSLVGIVGSGVRREARRRLESMPHCDLLGDWQSVAAPCSLGYERKTVRHPIQRS